MQLPQLVSTVISAMIYERALAQVSILTSTALATAATHETKNVVFIIFLAEE